MRFEYGWDNGKLVLDKQKLTKRDKELVKAVMDTAFHEMAERTRMGSGDDQAFVDTAYEQLVKEPIYKILVEVVFKLLKQQGDKKC